MQVQFDREKFKDLVEYICGQCSAAELGAVKLHKVLYFSDMIHYAAEGRPVTGAVYRKRPYGPTADFLLRAIDELQFEGRLSVEEQDYYGFNKKRFVSNLNRKPASISEEENQLVCDVIDFVCRNNTAKSISEFSHNKAWERTESGAEIPYYSAIELYPEDVSEEAMDWAAQEANTVEKIRSDTRRVDYKNVTDLRGFVLSS